MVFQCCVRGCKTVGTSGLQSFPTNKVVAEKWIEAIKAFDLIDKLNDNKLARSYLKVCKNHFQPTDFQPNADGKSKIFANSIPSLLLPNDTNETVCTSSTNVDVLKSVKAIKRPLEQFNQSKNTFKQRRTLEDTCNLEPDVLNSINDVEACTNSGVDVNSNTVPGNRKTSGHQCKTTLGKNTIEKLSRAALIRKLRDAQNRLKELKKNSKITDTKVMEYLKKKNMNQQQLDFMEMQITNCDRPIHGRRYKLTQKDTCLALYKHGPKCFRFMTPWLVLPTPRTVGRHSANILFKTGVDPNVLEAIKNAVKDWSDDEKYCVISWDEVSLKEHLDYCHSQDYIEGFVEMAQSTKPDFATHALTFMVRGIKIPFKQTTGYFYTNGIHAFELVELVKLMIEAVLATGLKPILSVCDQVHLNASTVNTLVNPAQPSKVQPGQLLAYTVNGHKIIHSYDMPHVLKTWRNNLVTKDLAHFISNRWRFGDTSKINNSIQIASWDHLIELYQLDLQSTQRRLPNLSPEHLKPNKLKMKVSLASQVFSNTCGTVMLRCIQEDQLPNYEGTAQLLLFVNDLFDSLNGSEDHQEGSLKGAVTKNSIHFAFWEYALSALPKMFFVDKLTGDTNNRSAVLKRTESSIRGYIEFTKLCFELNIPKVYIRNTGQDELENYFGSVKNCSVVDKLTPRQYRTGHATMTICNITGKNSLHANCESDKSTPILTKFNEFLFNCKTKLYNSNTKINASNGNVVYDPEEEMIRSEAIFFDDMILYDPESEEESCGEEMIRSEDMIDDMILYDPESEEESCLFEENVSGCVNVDEMIAFDPEFGEGEINFLESEAIKFKSNLILQKLIAFTKCGGCKIRLSKRDASTSQSVFNKSCKIILCALNAFLPLICHEKCLKKKLLKHIETIQTDLIGCSEHDFQMKNKMRELCAGQVIDNFCNNINSFLSGKSETLPVNYNSIQQLALEFRKKKKRIGKHTDIFK